MGQFDRKCVIHMTARGSLERLLPARVRRMNPEANERQQVLSPMRHIVDKVFVQ